MQDKLDGGVRSRKNPSKYFSWLQKFGRNYHINQDPCKSTYSLLLDILSAECGVQTSHDCHSFLFFSSYPLFLFLNCSSVLIYYPFSTKKQTSFETNRNEKGQRMRTHTISLHGSQPATCSPWFHLTALKVRNPISSSIYWH